LTSAALAGGACVWLPLAYMTLLAVCADLIIRRITPASAPDAVPFGANLLSVVLALGHFTLLMLVVLAVSGQTGMSIPARLGIFFAAGLFFGQVSNSNAHELIHRRTPLLYWLGVAVYTSLLFGHHATAHNKIHHRWAASEKDPNSAHEGEGFYRFALRAWRGSFWAGLKAEREAGGFNPYFLYVGGAGLTLILAALAAGLEGVTSLTLLASYAQIQLLLSDYVQHYGLQRKTDSDGKIEPLRQTHSWNSPHFFTSLLMLNAARHSDHHAHATRPYPALRMPGKGEAPILPHSLPVMAVIALFPHLWRRVMRRELALWRAEG